MSTSYSPENIIVAVLGGTQIQMSSIWSSQQFQQGKATQIWCPDTRLCYWVSYQLVFFWFPIRTDEPRSLSYISSITVLHSKEIWRDIWYPWQANTLKNNHLNTCALVFQTIQHFLNVSLLWWWLLCGDGVYCVRVCVCACMCSYAHEHPICLCGRQRKPCNTSALPYWPISLVPQISCRFRMPHWEMHAFGKLIHNPRNTESARFS